MVFTLIYKDLDNNAPDQEIKSETEADVCSESDKAVEEVEARVDVPMAIDLAFYSKVEVLNIVNHSRATPHTERDTRL